MKRTAIISTLILLGLCTVLYAQNRVAVIPLSSNKAGGTEGQVQYNENNKSTGAEVYYDKTTGNVGVGTNTPSESLDVNGNVKATSFIGDGSGLTGLDAVETDPTVPSNIKDGISWSEVSGRPAGLDDGDDVGLISESDPTVLESVKDGVTWGEIGGIPAGFADNTDNDTLSELSCSSGQLIAWNGSAWDCVSLQTGCLQGDFINCYEGPVGTMNIGTCVAGTRSCVQGAFSTTCAGQVVPVTESCFDGYDNDCDGVLDNGCACDVGDCNTCRQTSCTDIACTTQLNACDSNQDCLDFDTCYGNCTDSPCIKACQELYPTGSTLWYAIMNCFYCSACSVDCAAHCPILPVP